MPAKESHNRSQGCPLTFPLRTGGEIVVRNGLLFRNNTPIETKDPAAWIRQHCRLTFDQDYWLDCQLEAMHKTWTPTNSNVRHVVAPRHGGSIKEAGE